MALAIAGAINDAAVAELSCCVYVCMCVTVLLCNCCSCQDDMKKEGTKLNPWESGGDVKHGRRELQVRACACVCAFLGNATVDAPKNELSLWVGGSEGGRKFG